ncbi:integral membrane sensor signal transduction histidine kinase [Alkaliphilus metalliredigens QYMF]|uniref:histidine kinase n=1 Tax=Alkaliphilus metalliredigens (strain QYMF) TaxID=293826 RepID=A6TT52_ALKMQ|nr:ATP-binding protein [Alkaliphilus metalliredigens]ABR49370.1 integral membrane sensor signal transduction histidine kinase [Alkaliphilus metalliredigens QYMF]
MYTGNQYILLFFVYGLAFFSMGIAAFLQNTSEESSFPLLKCIHYLGFFGIIHGITEWIIMLRITNMVPQYQLNLLLLGTFTNALSFAFLWMFGAKLLQKEGKVKLLIEGLPWLLFGLWLMAVIASYMRYQTTSLHWIFIEDTMSRYFIGFPGALISALALYKNAKHMEQLNIVTASLQLKGMAIAFGVYGVLAGVVVKNKQIFPSNIINRENFFNLFGFPVELGRGISAIIITILFVSVIKVFQWEINKKIKRLTKHQIVSDERKKMGQELHDVIIQNLFATGLQVENIIEMEPNSKFIKDLHYIKNNLNVTITHVRQFIEQVASAKIQIEDLKLRLTGLVDNFQRVCNIPIELQYKITEVTLGSLSQEKATQIYYIVQEALSNAIKHSEANRITIDIKTTLNTVGATIKDDGKGFGLQQIPKGGHYGLVSMKERAANVNGLLDIKSNEKGTRVTITIPWEESEDAEED